MEVPAPLALPEELEVTEIETIDDVFTITAHCTREHPCCPLCGTPAQRFHSSYLRRITDLPSGGKRVCLQVLVRKCFCDVDTCVRKIFAERLTPFVKPLARVTTRLFQVVQALGLATGGMLGARLAQRLGIKISWMTILRRIMVLSQEPVQPVRELGIDDFAFRRGRKFGTILVDMISHQVIDVLPDRRAETAAAWMSVHPEIELVSRDRGGDYAAGARQGAPQAVQVADRFHLYKNLVEAVELILARCRAEIRKNVQAANQKESQEEASKPIFYEHAEVIAIENWKPEPEACDERARLARRDQRYDRYHQVLALYEQGLSFQEITCRVGVSRRTIKRWIEAGDFPEAKRRRKRPSAFDPYAQYVHVRWEQGCTNGLQLWKEIQAQGYQGSAQSIYRFLRGLRKKRRVIWKPEVPHAPLQDFSAHEAVWLFALSPDSLEEKEQETLTAICQASETARITYQLVQEFRHLLHHREGEKLDAWLAKCIASQVRELQSFVQGVERDKEAVVAGLTLPQNNGLVEGKVNKLKPRFSVEAHLESLFGETTQRTEQESPAQEKGGSAAHEQEERPAPVPLPTSLSPEEQEQLAQKNTQRHDWLEQLGAQDRSVTGRSYQRVADLQVSTTDPDATLMLTKNGADLGYHTHYVVDGGKARIILNVLVTPSEVMDNQPMLDLLWRTRFRWKLWPRQVTDDKKYGTEDNLVAIEEQSIRAYIPIPDMDHRTEFLSADQFRYEAERDIYLCPAGKELRFDRPHSTERSRRYRARAKDCNHCPLKAKCTTSKQGRSLCRSRDEACLDQVRAYQATEAYKKALRKRQVWVEPLFAEAKDWHGMRRFRLRRLWRVNSEALMIAAGLNLKRLLKKRGWGRHPFPGEAVCACFLTVSWWLTRSSLSSDVGFFLLGSDYHLSKTSPPFKSASTKQTALLVLPGRKSYTQYYGPTRTHASSSASAHVALADARRAQQLPEFKEHYDKRAGVEGTISQTVCALDMRRSRYIGLAKTHLQHVLTAAAINLIRVGAWLEEIPFAKTRRSPFAALRVA